MKPASPIKLVSQLLDLPLCDSDGRYCGIVDDLELSGGPGKELRLEALLVGPGAYEGRLPNWAAAIVRKLAGDRMTRVPIGKVESVGPVVRLDCPAAELGLDRSERRASAWMPHGGAL